MATVDVVTDTVINRPRREVSAYVCDPDNTTAWYANIDSVRWASPKPAVQGSQLEFVARFLGRTLTYTYEIVEVVRPGSGSSCGPRRARSRCRPPTPGPTPPTAAPG